MKNKLDQGKQKTSDKFVFNFSEKDLTPLQQRILTSTYNAMKHVLHTEDEKEFFQACEVLMKEVALMIKNSDFAKFEEGKIDYGMQALEFSLDSLQESLYKNKLNRFDN